MRTYDLRGCVLISDLFVSLLHHFRRHLGRSTNKLRISIIITPTSTESNEKVFHIAYMAMNQLHSDPDLVCDVVLMTMNRNDKPWGDCQLLNGGLPLLRSVQEETFKVLVQPLSAEITADIAETTAATDNKAAAAKAAASGSFTHPTHPGPSPSCGWSPGSRTRGLVCTSVL